MGRKRNKGKSESQGATGSQRPQEHGQESPGQSSRGEGSGQSPGGQPSGKSHPRPLTESAPGQFQPGQIQARGRGHNRGGHQSQYAVQHPDQPMSEGIPGYSQERQIQAGGRGRGNNCGGHQSQHTTQSPNQPTFKSIHSSPQQDQIEARGRGRGQNRGGPTHQQVGGRRASDRGYQDAAQSQPQDVTKRVSVSHSDSPRSTSDSHSSRGTSQQIVHKSGSPVEGVIEAMTKLKVAGKSGRLIEIYANHFELKLGKIQKVMHYDVDIKPDKPKKILKHIMQLFKAKYYPQVHPAFDGSKNLYSANDLPFGNEMSGTVTFEDEGRSKEYIVKMKKVNTIDISLINKFVNQHKTKNISIKEPGNAVQALDVILRHSLSLRFISCGNSIYPPPQGPILLGDGMEMYKGMFQSVTLGWKPFINIDVSNKAFPSEKKMIDLICEICKRNDLKSHLNNWELKQISTVVKTLRVRIEIPNSPSNKRTMRVNDVQSSSDKFKFTKDNGTQQTVQEYFLQEKKVHLKYPQMPCVWVGNKEKKIMYPCELCTILPGQVVNRKLNANQTRLMIRECATNTNVRMNSIKYSMQQANYNADPVIKEFDLSVSNEFHKVNGRVLNPPEIKYAQSFQKVFKGVWQSKEFLRPVEIKKWFILNLNPRLYSDKCEMFARQIQNRCEQLGVKISPPFEISTMAIKCKEIETLSNYFSKRKDADIIFVIIGEERNIYNFVKQASELNVGCLTQCIKSKTILYKLDESTVVNVLLKVNAKLNGVNHTFKVPPLVMKSPTMIMGADVTHPGPDSQTIPSFAAVTASYDIFGFKYNICWRIQPPTQEIITDLEAITKEQLQFFYRKCNFKPMKIIFYRDGVSNGQFQQVLSAELQAIRRACQSFNQDYKPTITFIVVQKRHHTRLFPVNLSDSQDKNKNVPAGTCVDTDITLPTMQNFFLVSHASIQGVARPTRYVVLWDDDNFKDIDDLENFTYQLCHLFTRCTRSVSYPAPTYYAHLAAARAKVYCETCQLNMNNLKYEQTRYKIQQKIREELPMFFV